MPLTNVDKTIKFLERRGFRQTRGDRGWYRRDVPTPKERAALDFLLEVGETGNWVDYIPVNGLRGRSFIHNGYIGRTVHYGEGFHSIRNSPRELRVPMRESEEVRRVNIFDEPSPTPPTPPEPVQTTDYIIYRSYELGSTTTGNNTIRWPTASNDSSNWLWPSGGNR